MVRRIASTLAAMVLVVAVADHAPAASNDPLFSRQWGLDKTKAEPAWAYARGAGVTIAIVDTGADLGHEDLGGKLVVAAGSNLTCGGNGRCDRNRPDDDNGHGTHVAGIAAAITGNGKGVAGMAPDARLMPVKVLDEEGSGEVETIAAGIRFAADRGAKVINLSLGELPGVHFLPGVNDDIDAAINHAWDRGSVVVAAAGNEGAPLCSYPAANQRVLCVGAVDRNDVKTFYSNFGLGIGVVAPGGVGSVFCEDDEDVWSTYPVRHDTTCKRQLGYETLAGTSMATPFVSGLAAMLLSRGLSNQQVVERIQATADDLGAPGYDPVFGAGRINALRAVQPDPSRAPQGGKVRSAKRTRANRA